MQEFGNGFFILLNFFHKFYKGRYIHVNFQIFPHKMLIVIPLIQNRRPTCAYFLFSLKYRFFSFFRCPRLMCSSSAWMRLVVAAATSGSDSRKSA